MLLTQPLSLEAQIDRLQTLAHALAEQSQVVDKIGVLNGESAVQEFVSERASTVRFVQRCGREEELVLKELVVLGQAEHLLAHSKGSLSTQHRLQSLLASLLPVEKFYAEMGGLVGYHLATIRLLFASEYYAASARVRTLRPKGIDLSQDNRQVRSATLWGVKGLPEIAEIYPVGGAADRLQLFDETTGEPLPAARLNFLGRTLLEGLIRDLQAREYLYFKLTGKQLLTPIAMMTSQDKNNHAQILEICRERGWFQRPRERFALFCQPLVPTMDSEGRWCLKAPMELLLKPGGHGVIWKLSRDAGIFEWFASFGCKKALVRQINNPIAGVDYGLLAFTGIGHKRDQRFGFASCPRVVHASEGINVLVERQREDGFVYTLSNIEYCDFRRFGIRDEPLSPTSPFSRFASNTNLLFVDLQEVARAAVRCPVPGMLVNSKRMRVWDDGDKEESVVRLESTMQNIADQFGELFAKRLRAHEHDRLRSYLTYNLRHRTISCTKRQYVEGQSLLETPEGCFVDLLKNAEELLRVHCHFELPPPSRESDLPFLFVYHPALGPLYSIIAQKLRGGAMGAGSECQLEIAELDVESLDLQGSLVVRADPVMGHVDEEGVLRYSNRSGKCTLKGVRVCNLGIEWEGQHCFWKNQISRREMCEILIHGTGEFYAENITLQGDLHIEVESGTRVVASQENGQLLFKRQRIAQPSWSWHYSEGRDGSIQLKKQ